MHLGSKPSELAVFERGRRAGQKLERGLMALKLHQVCECLTAAAFAVELAKESDDRQTELLSRAPKLLAEAMELAREGLDAGKVPKVAAKQKSTAEVSPAGFRMLAGLQVRKM